MLLTAGRTHCLILEFESSTPPSFLTFLNQQRDTDELTAEDGEGRGRGSGQEEEEEDENQEEVEEEEEEEKKGEERVVFRY